MGNAEVHVQRFSVAYEYPVVFTRDALRAENTALRSVIAEPSRVAVLVDEGVATAWPSLPAQLESYASAHDLSIAAAPRVVPGGERAKNDPALADALRGWLLTLGLDRHAYVIAIGGGAMLDVAGYAAATAHRGMRLVRMPTTVLAQNDAGIGVKNGINALGQKNAVGTFQPPHAVVSDGSFLSTLSPRVRRAGMAEAIKVALIRDASTFEWLWESRGALRALDPAHVDELVRRCALLHLDHIANGGDPFERGNARPLDYGHWAAHKLEVLSDHALSHGEAVAIGMAIDTRYAVEIGLCEARDADRVIALIRALGLPLWHAALEDRAALMQGLDEFRQHLGGSLRIPMLSAIGTVTEVTCVDRGALDRALTWLRERS